ncbi:MAG: NifB/NifX family molybdenum-iron cluster-binding protein [Candidatus Omnitrophica bacterium]|nr:NifB/NifX family molybdenum-iron cluster-binding protein [Candidatus Omnitrophota bacterium]
MKICVTSQGNTLESQVDPRFGRCQYFMIIDTDTLEFTGLPNPNIDGMGGVGVKSGQLMADHGVKVVLTGNVGPNAFQTLQAAGIEVISGVSGKVNEVVNDYKQGRFGVAREPNVDSKFGMN